MDQRLVARALIVIGETLAIMADFKNATVQAKFVPIDAAKLDSAKSIMKDECRVWILQKASGFEANPFL